MSVLTVALVGNPNIGKSTLFNRLTGGNQRVGNWPGLTVEQKSGYFELDQQPVHLIDLPGCYSLKGTSRSGDSSEITAVDAFIARYFIESHKTDCVINLIDASLMERHLYLTLQLLALGLPVIVVLNRMDLANQQGLLINTQLMSRRLGCPVVPMSAKYGLGIDKLKSILRDQLFSPNESQATRVAMPQPTVQPSYSTDTIILNAQQQHKKINDIVREVLHSRTASVKPAESWVDKIVLSPFWGVPLFLLVMYLLFVLSIDVGGVFQDCFDIWSSTLFIDAPMRLLHYLHCPNWLVALLANGIGQGLNTVVTFIPVLALLFFFLAWLEESGYMARAAFVMDRVMRIVGLPGKSFLPMIIGFGCNVPAVMSTRTLEGSRERIITILMAPFMSCSARLAVYAVFVSAFFAYHGAIIIFMLYLIGIMMALITGFILRKTLLGGQFYPLVLELPRYQLPPVKAVLRQMWRRLKGFVWRAGRLIVPICVCIGLLNALPVPKVLWSRTMNVLTVYSQRVPFINHHLPTSLQSSLNYKRNKHPMTVSTTASSTFADHPSLLVTIGQSFSPIFKPLGISSHNWPATVALLTGVLAKEVMVGSLNTLYRYSDRMGSRQSSLSDTSEQPILASLYQGLLSVRDHLSHLSMLFLHPFSAFVPQERLSSLAYKRMVSEFDGSVGALAYLLFVLLYFPCASTIAVVARELNRGWACFSVLWSTSLAYTASVLFYQLGTYSRHPHTTILWCLGIGLYYLVILFLIRMYAKIHPTLGAYTSQHLKQALIATAERSNSMSSSLIGCSKKCSGCH